MLQLLLAVFIGGGTGSVARWLLSMRFNPLHQAIPLGTLAANLIGAFIIGMGFAWFSFGWALLNVFVNLLGSFAMTALAFWLFSASTAH